jgi:1,4-dihydroxy-2-naphthoyl-CoA hydrolase
VADSGEVAHSVEAAGPLGGFNELLGIRVEEASPERVVVRLRVDERHLQPYGIVHGGVHATLAEMAASIGAALSALHRDPRSGAVGLENHTTFLRAARDGADLTAVATPLHAGRRTQSWQVEIRDETNGKLVARSTVRLLTTSPSDL